MEGQLSSGQASGVGNPHGLAGCGMNDPGVRTAGATKLPDALVVVSSSGSDAHDSIEFAEGDSSRVVGFQGEAPGVLEIGSPDRDVEILACSGLPASSEKLDYILSIHPAQEKIPDPITAKLSVDRKGLVCRELDLLLPLAGYLDCGDQSDVDPGEPVGDPDFVSSLPVRGDLEVVYRAGGGDAVEVG